MEKVTEGNSLVESTTVEKPNVRYAYERTRVLCQRAKGPNAVPFTLGWGTRLMRESKSAHEEAADFSAPPQTAGEQPEVESTRDEVEETQHAEHQLC